MKPSLVLRLSIVATIAIIATVGLCSPSIARASVGQQPTIETFVDEALPVPPSVNMSWQRPLKGGEVKLSRPFEARPHIAPLAPVAGSPMAASASHLKPPVMSSSSVAPAPIYSKTDSASHADSMKSMLMDGLRNALATTNDNMPTPITNYAVDDSIRTPLYKPPSAEVPYEEVVITSQSSPDSSVPNTLPSNSSDTTAAVVASTPASVSGQCGAASGIGMTAAPSQDLCFSGVPSQVNGIGPWTWACAGKNGGTAESCKAFVKTDGVCGTAMNVSVYDAPSENLCVTGASGSVSGDNDWHWTCAGAHGGQAAQCIALKKQDGVCGAATAKTWRESPKTELCAIGSASVIAAGTLPWQWNCGGVNGGNPAVCKAQPTIDAGCGAAHGNTYTKAPIVDLCNLGYAGDVKGNGPWTWTCSGFGNGDTASCTAAFGERPQTVSAPVVASATAAAVPPSSSEASSSMAVKTTEPTATVSTVKVAKNLAACGKASASVAWKKPTRNLCDKGTASAVTGKGIWRWQCVIGDGEAISCETLNVATPENMSGQSQDTSFSSTLTTPNTSKTALLPLKAGEIPSLKSSHPVTAKQHAPILPADSKIMADIPAVAPPLPAEAVPVPPPPKAIPIPPVVASPVVSPTEAVTEGIVLSNFPDVPETVVISSSHMQISEDAALIKFDENSEVLDDDARDALKEVIASMKAVPDARITLTAYASIGDTSPRSARRLSLSRALVVRSYLTSGGISNERVDVRALGANYKSGNPERVDITVN